MSIKQSKYLFFDSPMELMKWSLLTEQLRDSLSNMTDVKKIEHNLKSFLSKEKHITADVDILVDEDTHSAMILIHDNEHFYIPVDDASGAPEGVVLN